MSINKKNLILGAGPAGLCAAYELHKNHQNVILVEKDSKVGGLSKTLTFGGFRTDIGPHRFFSKNQFLYDFIADLLGAEWIKVSRSTRFYIKNKIFVYPVEFGNVIKNMEIDEILNILIDFSKEKILGLLKNKKIKTFEDQALSDFGKTLAELNVLNYTEKIWGVPCSKISPDWATQRIKGLSVMGIIKNMLLKSQNGPKTLVDQFYYPKNGTGSIFDMIADTVFKNTDNRLMVDTYPVKVIHNGRQITEVIINGRYGTESVNPSYLISSIPITEIVRLFDPVVPNVVLNAADKLKFRSHNSLFITVNRDSIFKDQWIYFPEQHVPFGRIMEPKNFSSLMSPKSETSLLIEFFCWENDSIWKSEERGLLDISMPFLKKYFSIEEKDILQVFIHREKYAYPVYDLDYRHNLDTIKHYLESFSNLISIGRAGLFRYNNQDHAMEMGILAARSIIDGKKYNIDDIGAGKEYFEKGYVK